MGRLQKVIHQSGEAADMRRKEREVPVYDMSGRFYSPQRTRRRRGLAIAAIAAAAAAAFLYLPGFFMDEQGQEEETAAVSLDTTAVRTNSQVLRDYPNEDFDGDGLINSEESTYGSDPWLADTDGDGATDYYEVKISDTSPSEADSSLLSDLQTKADQENGKSVSSPYKIGNVILWAGDYQSKANGSVVETLDGYRFCGFSGYAQFPDDVKYAYKYEDGVHTLLDYREAENAWLIEGDCTVDTFSEKMEEVIDLAFFSHHIYADPSGFMNALAKILPDRGFLTAQAMVEADIEPDVSGDTVTDIVKPSYDSNDSFRFQTVTNTLEDLLYVMESIDNGSCIAVSLYKPDAGEYIGIIYGYTSGGDLLIADAGTLEPVGTLTVEEKARIMIGQSREMVSVSYFDFCGLGFDSAGGDRISFFAASDGNASYSGMLQEETEEDAGDSSITEDSSLEDDTASGTTDDSAQAGGTDIPADTGFTDTEEEDDEVITSSGLGE